MSGATVLWALLIFGFALFIGGPVGAISLFVVAVAIVAVIVGSAALLDWLAKH